MPTFATKNKHADTAVHRRPRHAPSAVGNIKHGKQPNIRHILRSPAVQPKLTIGAPNDKYEQEADRVADQVMRAPQEVPLGYMSESGIQRQSLEDEEDLIQTKPNESLLQRQPSEEEEEELIQTKPLNGMLQHQVDTEEEETLQAKAAPGHTPTVGATTHAKIQSLKGGGEPLSPTTRAFFEPRFGRDLSQVRIHTDSQASDISRSINAKAFTVGRDVVFGAGQHQPQTTEGKRLLAHELVHVGQQQRLSHTTQYKTEQPKKNLGHTHGLRIQRDKDNEASSDKIEVHSWMILHDPEFFEHAIQRNKYHANHASVEGWPYRRDLRLLWEQKQYEFFVGEVLDFQINVIGIPQNDKGADGILGPSTAAFLKSKMTENESAESEEGITQEISDVEDISKFRAFPSVKDIEESIQIASVKKKEREHTAIRNEESEAIRKELVIKMADIRKKINGLNKGELSADTKGLKNLKVYLYSELAKLTPYYSQGSNVNILPLSSESSIASVFPS